MKIKITYLLTGVCALLAQPVMANTFYVSNQHSTTVSYGDSSRNPPTITNAITGFSSPWQIAVTPDGAKAYVLNFGDNSVSVINTADNTVAGAISGPCFSTPQAVAFTPNGLKAYVANTDMGGDGWVTIIDVVNNEATGRVLNGNFTSPFSVAFTPDGKKAYVANQGASSAATGVSIIDVASNTATGFVSNGNFSGACWVAITPNGKKAYVANLSNNTVSIIDVATDTTATDPVDDSLGAFNTPTFVAFTEKGKLKGKKAYVTNQNDNSVSVIDVTSNKVTRLITDDTFNAPYSIAMAPDGIYAYVANSVGNTLTIIRIADDTVVGTVANTSDTPLNGTFFTAFVPNPSSAGRYNRFVTRLIEKYGTP